jgi:hypothetical protein
MSSSRWKERDSNPAWPLGPQATARAVVDLARRLFSCPSCGAHWVLFTPNGAAVVGVRAPMPDDPSPAALVCSFCLAAVDRDGVVVVGTSRD